MPDPLVVAIEMGYGHLRPGHALSRELGVPLLEVDRPPLAGAEEQALWARTRRLYEGLSRLSQVPGVGAPLRRVLDGITFIPPLHPLRDLSPPTRATKVLGWLARNGLGRGMVDRLRASGAPLLTTFFAPAIIADEAGLDEAYCVVTDSDINRVWAPERSTKTRVRYLCPSHRAARRLATYGIPADNLDVTGYPLPGELLGGPELPALRQNLAGRLVRLDPGGAFRRVHADDLARHVGPLPADQGGPPLLTYAVGGAGAQAELVDTFLPGLAPMLAGGRLRLCLVAGIRQDVAAKFAHAMERVPAAARDAITVVLEPNHDAYFRRFNEVLAGTDVLWTKPSEVTFFGGLGLPLVFSWPVGVHEQYNRRWAIEAGAGLAQRDPRFAAEWLADWLADGTLAAAAWAGFRNLPARGLYRIAGRLRGSAILSR